MFATNLDLTLEDAGVAERYHTSHLMVHRYQKSQDGACTLGKLLLTVRRLCEAGCRFVTVASGGLDMHGDGNNSGVHQKTYERRHERNSRDQKKMLRTTDRANRS